MRPAESVSLSQHSDDQLGSDNSLAGGAEPKQRSGPTSRHVDVCSAFMVVFMYALAGKPFRPWIPACSPRSPLPGCRCSLMLRYPLCPRFSCPLDAPMPGAGPARSLGSPCTKGAGAGRHTSGEGLPSSDRMRRCIQEACILGADFAVSQSGVYGTELHRGACHGLQQAALQAGSCHPCCCRDSTPTPAKGGKGKQLHLGSFLGPEPAAV